VKTTKCLFGVAAALSLSGCIQTGPAVSGAAGGATSIGASDSLQRCSEPLGTLAVDDSRRQGWWSTYSQNAQVTTLEPMIRLVVQQSNCFVITSLGSSDVDSRINQIMAQQRGGDFRAGSNVHRGQRVVADYYMQPSIVLGSGSNIGGTIQGLSGAFGGPRIPVSLPSFSQSSAQVVLSMFDMRAGTQLTAAEGSGTASNYGALVAGLGGGAAGFSSTPAGQASLSAFVDAYNKMVVALRNYKAQNVRGGLGTGGQIRPQGR
jgi:hypothetical protein